MRKQIFFKITVFKSLNVVSFKSLTKVTHFWWMVLSWELNVSFRNSINNIKGIFKHNSFKNVHKVFNLETSETVYYFGKVENARFLHEGLFHGITNKPKAIITLEMKASNNTNLQVVKHDPTLLCTAYKKNRFYLFTRRESENTKK